MKVVYNWLKDFVEVTATPQELASRLALSGTNIAGVESARTARSSTPKSVRIAPIASATMELPAKSPPSTNFR